MKISSNEVEIYDFAVNQSPVIGEEVGFKLLIQKIQGPIEVGVQWQEYIEPEPEPDVVLEPSGVIPQVARHPAASGVPEVGEAVTGDLGEYTGTGHLDYEVQWQEYLE